MGEALEDVAEQLVDHVQHLEVQTKACEPKMVWELGGTGRSPASAWARNLFDMQLPSHMQVPGEDNRSTSK